MCGFGMQSLDDGAAARDVFTVGCLEKIVGWTRTNMVLVGGLTAGLLLLEVTREVPVDLRSTVRLLPWQQGVTAVFPQVCLIGLASAQISIIIKVQKQKQKESRDRAASHRKESVWLPAFADIPDQ